MLIFHADLVSVGNMLFNIKLEEQTFYSFKVEADSKEEAEQLLYTSLKKYIIQDNVVERKFELLNISATNNNDSTGVKDGSI